MSMIKKFCETHHFYYQENVCPFCQNERFNKFLKDKPKKEEKEVTIDDIQKLINKFNTLKK